MTNELTPDELRLRAAAKELETIELLKRVALGKDRKLWRITARFTTDYSNETKLHELTNRTWGEIMHFRVTIFEAGLMFPIDPGHWVVIAPWHIKEIHVYRQDKFFEP